MGDSHTAGVDNPYNSIGFKSMRWLTAPQMAMRCQQIGKVQQLVAASTKGNVAAQRYCITEMQNLCNPELQSLD